MSIDRRDFLTATLGSLTGFAAVPGSASLGIASTVSTVSVLQCHVAGTSYAGLPDEYEATLSSGQTLLCQREPENPADSLAIRVQDLLGRKVGYIPRAKNEVLARLMDAGISAHAEVVGWERVGHWLRIDIDVQVRLPPQQVQNKGRAA